MRNASRSLILASAIAGVFGFAAVPASATVTYSTWKSNEAPNGNYIFTVNHDIDDDEFDYSLTVVPWTAEALGLFIDLGDVVIGTVTITDTSPAGTVTLFAKDTKSSSCGTGCNLNGLAPPAREGGDWELVFRLGTVGFDNIQTFSWTTGDFGLDEAAFGIVGIRAQQLCDSGTLPDGNCGNSDKVWGVPENTFVPPEGDPIPEPGVLFLMGAGLLGLGMARRRKAA